MLTSHYLEAIGFCLNHAERPSLPEETFSSIPKSASDVVAPYTLLCTLSVTGSRFSMWLRAVRESVAGMNHLSILDVSSRDAGGVREQVERSRNKEGQQELFLVNDMQTLMIQGWFCV